jgi:hypothetical protein
MKTNKSRTKINHPALDDSTHRDTGDNNQESDEQQNDHRYKGFGRPIIKTRKSRWPYGGKSGSPDLISRNQGDETGG